MGNFYHTCEFSTVTINFSELWARQILHLRKQSNLMIRLGNVLKTSFQDVLKMSWRRLQKDLKISWRCLEDVSARRLEEVLQTSWQDILKTSWKRLDDFLKTYGKDEYVGLDKDVFWKRMTKANIFVLIKTSWRRVLNRNTKDVFIKTNVCSENISSDMEWRIWITWWIIFCIRYSKLFWIYFKKTWDCHW